MLKNIFQKVVKKKIIHKSYTHRKSYDPNLSLKRPCVKSYAYKLYLEIISFQKNNINNIF